MRNYWLNRNHVFRFYQPDRTMRFDFLSSVGDWDHSNYARETSHFAKFPFARPSEPRWIDRWFDDDDGHITILLPAASAANFFSYLSKWCWKLSEPDENGYRHVLGRA